MGVPPSQVWGYPIQSLWPWGYLILPDEGYPMDGGTHHHQDWMGVPPPSSLGRGCPPSRPGKGVPLPIQTWEGIPPPHPDLGMWHPHPDLGRGYPLPSRLVPGRGGTPNQSTCYAAGGMPLAFTLEDFLVCVVWSL